MAVYCRDVMRCDDAVGRLGEVMRRHLVPAQSRVEREWAAAVVVVVTSGHRLCVMGTL